MKITIQTTINADTEKLKYRLEDKREWLAIYFK